MQENTASPSVMVKGGEILNWRRIELHLPEPQSRSEQISTSGLRRRTSAIVESINDISLGISTEVVISHLATGSNIVCLIGARIPAIVNGPIETTMASSRIPTETNIVIVGNPSQIKSMRLLCSALVHTFRLYARRKVPGLDLRSNFMDGDC